MRSAKAKRAKVRGGGIVGQLHHFILALFRTLYQQREFFTHAITCRSRGILLIGCNEIRPLPLFSSKWRIQSRNGSPMLRLGF